MSIDPPNSGYRRVRTPRYDRRMRKLLIIPTLAVLALTGCSAAAAHPAHTTPKKPTTFLVNGSITLNGESSFLALDSGCQGTEGYDDITAGAQVVIADASGKTLGIGQLDAGSVTGDGSGCALPFAINHIPIGPKFYQVTVSHRGAVQFASAQMHSAVALTIG